MMERLSAEKRVLFLVSFFVCLVLVVYGNYHYQYRNIVYTDDDYDVFNDAAKFIINEEIMASLNTLSKANTKFSLDLFKQLSNEDKMANVFYSPFSISSALAMVMLGARGTTASQMTEESSTTSGRSNQFPAVLISLSSPAVPPRASASSSVSTFVNIGLRRNPPVTPLTSVFQFGTDIWTCSRSALCSSY